MGKEKDARTAAKEKGHEDGYAGNDRNPPSSYGVNDFLGDVGLAFFTGGLWVLVKGIVAVSGTDEFTESLDYAYERGYLKGKRKRLKEFEGNV